MKSGYLFRVAFEINVECPIIANDFTEAVNKANKLAKDKDDTVIGVMLDKVFAFTEIYY